jgi:hypothetical protein
VLERFHISRAAFEELRSDSYEKHIARRSLDELEAFYTALLNTGEHYVAIQKVCPRWDDDEKHAGKLPSIRTLTVIKRRIMAEHTVDSLGANEQFLKVFRARAKGLPAERQAALYDTILELLGNELIAAMLEGKPLLGNLKGVDRIMKAKAMATRAEQGKRRLKIREGGLRIRTERLEWQCQQRQKADEGRGSRAEGQAGNPEALSGDNEEEGEEEYDPEAMDETDVMMEKVFGKNPFKNQRDAGPALKTSTAASMSGNHESR